MSNVIVFCEHADGSVRRASLEAIGAAKAAGAEVTAVLWGPGADAAASTATGASNAIALTGQDAYSPDAVASAVAVVLLLILVVPIVLFQINQQKQAEAEK